MTRSDRSLSGTPPTSVWQLPSLVPVAEAAPEPFRSEQEVDDHLLRAARTAMTPAERSSVAAQALQALTRIRMEGARRRGNRLPEMWIWSDADIV